MESYDPAEMRGTPLFELTVDSIGKEYLGRAGKWARFLAITGFVFLGLYAIFIFIAMGSAPDLGDYPYSPRPGLSMNPMAMSRGLGIIFVIIMIGIGIWPFLFLWNFSSKALNAVRSDDPEMLSDSFRNLKRYFQFLGIITIIALAFMLLGMFTMIMAFGMR